MFQLGTSKHMITDVHETCKIITMVLGSNKDTEALKILKDQGTLLQCRSISKRQRLTSSFPVWKPSKPSKKCWTFQNWILKPHLAVENMVTLHIPDYIVYFLLPEKMDKQTKDEAKVMKAQY